MPRSAPGNIATTPSLADFAVKTLKDHVAPDRRTGCGRRCARLTLSANSAYLGLCMVHVEISEEAAEADERRLSRGAKDGPRPGVYFPLTPDDAPAAGMMTVTTP